MTKMDQLHGITRSYRWHRAFKRAAMLARRCGRREPWPATLKWAGEYAASLQRVNRCFDGFRRTVREETDSFREVIVTAGIKEMSR